MTAPSRFLVDLYRGAGATDARLVENAVSAADVGRRRPRHAGVVIGWVAGREHETDLKKLRVANVLQGLLNVNDGLRVVTYGVDLGIRDPRYRHIANVPIDQLVRHETEFDIGIAPLADTPFNRGRSDIKVKEYASAGVCWLASPVGPYIGLGEAQGGRLVDDGDWPQTLQTLVEDHQQRTALAERARSWARTRSIRHLGEVWERALRAAAAQARSARSAA